jgi:hypothetical protein
MSRSSGRTALCRKSSASALPVFGGGVRVSRVDYKRVCQVLLENRVHIGERALAPNFRLRRHHAGTSRLFPTLRVSFVGSFSR